MSYTDSGFDKRVRNLLVADESAAPPQSPVILTSYGAAPAPFTPPPNSLLIVVSLYGFDVGVPNPFPFFGNTTTQNLAWSNPYTVVADRGGGYLVTLQLWVAEIGPDPLAEDVAFGWPYISSGCVFTAENYDTADPIGAVFTSALSGPADGPWNSALDSAPAQSSAVITAIGGVASGGGTLNAELGTGFLDGGYFVEAATIMLKGGYRLDSVSDFCGWADVLAPSSTDTYYGDPPGPIGLAFEVKAA